MGAILGGAVVAPGMVGTSEGDNQGRITPNAITTASKPTITKLTLPIIRRFRFFSAGVRGSACNDSCAKGAMASCLSA
jgi:hypothetical protein